MMNHFGKVITAMVTPFDNDGRLDLAKTTELIEYLINNGTDALVVAGTTGESPTLTKDEKLALFKHAVQVVNKRVPIIAGTGSNNTSESIALTKAAEEIGIDAAMLVAPYYNKPNQEGLYQHFKAIAEATNLPIMLYNVPGRTIVRMSVDTIVRLSKIENVVAIKDAGGDLAAMAEVIAKTANNFTLYSGDDGITLPVLAIGGKGVVSVASHVIGNEMQEMIKAYEQGEMEKAQQLNGELIPKMTKLFLAPSPTPVKTALQVQGLDVGPVRLPLVPLSESERKTIVELFG